MADVGEPRRCVLEDCRRPIVRRPLETLSGWQRRLTCSRRCHGELISRQRRGVPRPPFDAGRKLPPEPVDPWAELAPWPPGVRFDALGLRPMPGRLPPRPPTGPGIGSSMGWAADVAGGADDY